MEEPNGLHVMSMIDYSVLDKNKGMNINNCPSQAFKDLELGNSLTLLSWVGYLPWYNTSLRQSFRGKTVLMIPFFFLTGIKLLMFCLFMIVFHPFIFEYFA